jgi:hypothetical protein
MDDIALFMPDEREYMGDRLWEEEGDDVIYVWSSRTLRCILNSILVVAAFPMGIV